MIVKARCLACHATLRVFTGLDRKTGKRLRLRWLRSPCCGASLRKLGSEERRPRSEGTFYRAARRRMPEVARTVRAPEEAAPEVPIAPLVDSLVQRFTR